MQPPPPPTIRRMEQPGASSPNPARWRHIADAAIRVLASQGARGLTHRSVDREAGLPVGSTSNLFRTREQLLEGALDQMIHGDFETVAAPTEGAPSAEGAPRGEGAPPVEGAAPATVASAAVQLAALIHTWTAAEARPRLVARYELLLEASRRPTLAAALHTRRDGLVSMTEPLLAALGSAAPREHARSLIFWVDGLLLSHVLEPNLAYGSEELQSMVAPQLQPWD